MASPVWSGVAPPGHAAVAALRHQGHAVVRAQPHQCCDLGGASGRGEGERAAGETPAPIGQPRGHELRVGGPPALAEQRRRGGEECLPVMHGGGLCQPERAVAKDNSGVKPAFKRLA